MDITTKTICEEDRDTVKQEERNILFNYPWH
jgi:hypothetical protein